MIKWISLVTAVVVCIMAGPSAAARATLNVGPTRLYKTPCEALMASHDGDLIEVDAAAYIGDVCTIVRNSLSIRGVGGRARIDAGGKSAQGKSIWVIAGNDTIIENVEFSNCKVADKNGAGIRQEGTNLTLRHCSFYDNENGILTGAQPESEILIESCDFSQNGIGDGYSHNIYIGKVRRFTMRFSYSHQSRGGQLLKSRATENYITYNRLLDESDSNYELDLPNGGRAYVIGNWIQQSPSATNSTLVSYGAEGPIPDSRLYLINNSFINDRWTGIFVNIKPVVDSSAVIVNNIFFGSGQICTQTNARLINNYIGTNPGFVDRRGYNYSLEPFSECIDRGVDPGMAGDVSLYPLFHYVSSLGWTPRKVYKVLDIGACELRYDQLAACTAAAFTKTPCKIKSQNPQLI